MTYAEMLTDAKYSCGLEQDATFDAQLKNWLNRGLEVFERRYLWPFLYSDQTVTTTSGTETYDLDTDTMFVYMVRDTTNDRKLRYITNREFYESVPDPTATGAPYLYRLTGMRQASATDAPLPQISFYVIPGGTYTIKVPSYLRMTPLTDDTDIPALPAEFHELLVHYACMRFFLREEPTRAKSHNDLFENGMKDAADMLGAAPLDQMNVLRSIDDFAGTGVVQFPPSFPGVRW